MKKILICWIGLTDLKAAKGIKEAGIGPIAQAVTKRTYHEIVLINDGPKNIANSYLTWLKGRTITKIVIHSVKLTGPTHFGDIYEAAVKVVIDTYKRISKEIELTFHISPGTSQMAAVWIILSKTRFPAELIESSPKHGVKTSSVPFDISAEFIPDLLRRPDRRLEELSAALPPEAPEFSEIIHKSNVMKRVIVKARHVAPRSVPVLIEGESGTGKELMARAIHTASLRNDKPFIPVNCGAIPSQLVESEFFGHEKGAFTGAEKSRKGHFEEADKGTLFLDEIGELPLSTQVKLLRVLQEGEIVRVGATNSKKVDVRIIAATNRDLTKRISSGKFRSDLFYRIAVAILKLPPLRHRCGDVGLLIDRFLDRINAESAEEPGYKYKKISVSAKNIMINHNWPGNVRELINTLRRAAIWSGRDKIGVEDIRESLITIAPEGQDEILNKPLGGKLDLPSLMSTVARHYLNRALDEVNGNKTKASELLGLPSYQTLSNWMKKYGVE